MDALLVEVKAMQSEGENVNFNEDHAALIMFDIVLGKISSFGDRQRLRLVLSSTCNFFNGC